MTEETQGLGDVATGNDSTCAHIGSLSTYGGIGDGSEARADGQHDQQLQVLSAWTRNWRCDAAACCLQCSCDCSNLICRTCR